MLDHPAQELRSRSQGGQVAFGNIHNIDISFRLSAAEGKLNDLDVPDEAREETGRVLAGWLS